MDSDSIFSFPILIGDIGGTNARFSILIDAFAEPKRFPTLPTADYPTIDDAIQSGVLDKTSIQPKTAILAIAGPIDGDEIDLTNCDWVVKPKKMISDLGFDDVVVINDFEAQALAVGSVGDDDRVQIGGGNVDPSGSRVVLGPGTGLGVAGLIYSHGTWIPVPGEGGHVDIGPRNNRDMEIFPHLTRIEGRVSAEEVLSGRGIVSIYRAVCTANKTEPKWSDPAEITAAGLDQTDETAIETLSLFATYLGRVAGDMALIFTAKGGVYLAGGISQKILPALQQPEFRQAFSDKAPHSDILRDVPTYVMTHPLAALFGLAAYACAPRRFGVVTDGRRWQRK